MKNLKNEEITPEMIQTGVQLLSDYDRGWDDPQELVKAIFTAMAQVKKEGESR